MTDEQFSVLTNLIQVLISQHTELMQQNSNIYIALVVISFAFIIMIALMLFAAAWSVRSVVKSINIKNERLEEKILELTAKFNLLVEIMLEDAKRKRSGQS